MSHEFRFRNTGNRPLLITQVKPGCGCVKAGPYDKEVPPGGSGKISLTINTKGLKGKNLKAVVVNTNDLKLPTLRLQLALEIVAPIQVDPPSVQFDALQDDVKQQRVVIIVNNTDTPLELTDIKHEGAKLDTELKALKPGKEFELTVTAVPPFDSEYLDGVITLGTNLPKMPRLTITAKGHRRPTIIVIPKELSVQSPLPDEFKQQVLVRHGQGRAFELNDLKVTGQQLKVSLEEVQGGGKMYRITLTGSPGYEVPKAGEKITFATDDPSMPQVTVGVLPHIRP